jgi:hypothetical protein
MSTSDYDDARKRISSSSKKQFFFGPKSPSEIEDAQRRLKVYLPPLYKRFIQEYGAGGIGSFEIYGLTGRDFATAGVPDVVWYTEKARREWNLPVHLIPIYDLGDGEVYCLDTRVVNVRNEECPIVAIIPEKGQSYLNFELLYDDFGSFLLSLVDVENQISKS